MNILNDTSIFSAVIEHGGFSHAAKQLGLSNGLISRRIAKLEAELGVTLIKRTTRQFQLTQEGELFWRHAKRIQKELDDAVTLIHTAVKKPKGMIRVSAPLYFGRKYLTPILINFLNRFPDIKIDLDLSNQHHDLIKEKLDLVIRGAGFFNATTLKNSQLKTKLLVHDTIGLYASAAYLHQHTEPQSATELSQHVIVSYIDSTKLQELEEWKYSHKNKENAIIVNPKFRCTDVESSLLACISGFGIGKFTGMTVKNALEKKQLFPILKQYNWGEHNLFALYSDHHALPQRIRLLLDFIHAQVKTLNLK